jgi:hypothetical protein
MEPKIGFEARYEKTRAVTIRNHNAVQQRVLIRVSCSGAKASN